MYELRILHMVKAVEKDMMVDNVLWREDKNRAGDL